MVEKMMAERLVP